MPLAAGVGGAACVVVVGAGGGAGAGAFIVVGWGDGFGAGLATFAACPEAVCDGGLAAVAPLPLPPQPATISATIGTAAAPAMNWMDLVRIMVLLWLSLYDRPGATVGAGAAPGSGGLMTAPSRAEDASGMGTRRRLRPCGPQAPGRESPTPAAESRPNPTVAGGG